MCKQNFSILIFFLTGGNTEHFQISYRFWARKTRHPNFSQQLKNFNEQLKTRLE